MNERLKTFEEKMKKTLETGRRTSAIRAGRANPSVKLKL